MHRGWAWGRTFLGLGTEEGTRNVAVEVKSSASWKQQAAAPLSNNFVGEASFLLRRLLLWSGLDDEQWPHLFNGDSIGHRRVVPASNGCVLSWLVAVVGWGH